MDGARFGVRQDVPRAGEHTREILAQAGYAPAQIDDLLARKVIAAP